MARFLLVLAIATLVAPVAHAQDKRPNIVFIFTDDQRADTIAALGNGHIKTPNLDKLVHRGTVFRRAYCMGSMQGAVCVPSRAMMLSGRSLFRINDGLKGITTWPAMFSRAGYRTFITGKWHNQAPSVLAAFSEGKNIFFGGMGMPDQLPVADITPKRTLTEKTLSGKHSVELFTDSAIDFIKERKGKPEPFVAYVSFNGPHDPRVAPKEYHALYDKSKPPVPPNFLPTHPFNNGELTVRDERLAPWPRTKEIVQQHLADYYAYITFVDAQVGRIVEALRDAGLDENTIIVFASDHGLAIGSHGLFGKQNLYDHSMRAPMIFAGPGVPKGKTSDALVYLFDIFPTLGELTKVQGPEGSEGMSLVPALKGRPTRESLFTAYRQFQRAVRDDRWHLIVYPQINKTQLFDLSNDPHEIKDLAGDPMYAKTITRLMDSLKDWQQKLGDKQALRSENPQPAEFDFSKVGPEEKKKKKGAFLPSPLRGRGAGGEGAAPGGSLTIDSYRLPIANCPNIPRSALQLAIANCQLSIVNAFDCGASPSPPTPLPRWGEGREFLDNGTIKLGVDLNAGGTITYLSPSKLDKNVVNNFDFGRQIQMAYYSGPVPFVVGDKEPAKHWRHLGWNPVQSGDDFKNPSKVIDSSNDGKSIYVKCIPMQWPLDNEPAECTFETWIRLDGSTARVKCRLSNQRGDMTQYAARTQELPAVYTNAPYHRLMTYTGEHPFTDDALTQITRPKDHKGPWMHWLATECWAAHVDDNDWGLGVWHPGVRRFIGGFAGKPGRGGTKDEPTGYLAPYRQEILDHNIVHEYEYILILGKLADIRAHVVKHAKRPSPPTYHFRADRQGWYYINATDAGWPIKGELKVMLDKDDPRMLGPATFFVADDAPKLRIEAAFQTREKSSQFFWSTFDAPEFKEENSIRFPIVGDGKFRVYEVVLAKVRAWRGTITGLRWDPTPVGHAEESVRVKSIALGN